MKDQTKEILLAFGNYSKAFQTLDPKEAVPYFHKPGMFITADGVQVMAEEAQVTVLLQKVMNQLQAKAYDRTETKNINVRQLSDILAVVTADAIRYKKDGTELERFSITYTMRKTEKTWQIIVAIIHDTDSLDS